VVQGVLVVAVILDQRRVERHVPYERARLAEREPEIAAGCGDRRVGSAVQHVDVHGDVEDLDERRVTG
jgi:hypothetical protein